MRIKFPLGKAVLLAVFFVQLAVASTIRTFDFRESPLSDVFKVFTLQTNKNIIVSPSIKDLKVTLYLEQVTPKQALDVLCKNYGLWYSEDGPVIRVMKTDEYSRGIAFSRTETVRGFPLRYASSLSIAEIVVSLYGDRILYLPPGTMESFNHIGSDGYPTIGEKSDDSKTAETSNKQNAQHITSKEFTDMGGVSASAQDIQRLINTIGTVNRDSLMSMRLGKAQAFMTVSLRDNSVLIRSVDTSLINDLGKLITGLDTPTRQVLLEMKILEVTLGDGFESFVDMQIAPKGGKLDGISLLNQGNLLSSTLKTAILGDGFSIQMEMFEQDDRVKKVGSPVMFCANNASAKIFQGVESSLRKGYTVTSNKNDKGEITETILSVQLKDEEAGVRLEISPSINEDKTVTMKIGAEISTVLLGGGPEIPYGYGGNILMGKSDVLRKTSIQGIVAAADGQAVALGGLVEEQDVRTERKVPVLGSIPVLKYLFSSQKIKKERKEIVFLIRPHIIESPELSGAINGAWLKQNSEHPFATDGAERILEKMDFPDIQVPVKKGKRRGKSDE